MWIATTIGWFDAVRDRDAKGGLLIKARCKADIENLHKQFSRRHKMSKVLTDPKGDWDYRYGLKMSKRTWARIVGELAMRIDYCFFKGAVHDRWDQANKTQAYLSIWSTMLEVQNDEGNGGKYGKRYGNWDREIAYASGRFDYEAPEPTKTIKSVVREYPSDIAS